MHDVFFLRFVDPGRGCNFVQQAALGAGKNGLARTISISMSTSSRILPGKRASVNMAANQTPAPRSPKASTRADYPVHGIDFDFSFAFQPIVDAITREIVSFEALVRGPHGESSTEVFARVPRGDWYLFDEACRLKAIHLAKRLNLNTRLNLNLFPNSNHRRGVSIRATLQASIQEGFPVERLVFEISESERQRRCARVRSLFRGYKEWGFQTAIDDFGSGFSGMQMLAEFQPNYIKLDRNLITGIHLNHVKQVLVRGVTSICHQLAIEPIAEGVEKAEEYNWLRKLGIHLFQGYYFGRPMFEALPEVQLGLFL
jgi:EAL domain-containing protein (putative c-di-GMP-specific phosphodiesterase class I)